MPNLDDTDHKVLFQCECGSDGHRVEMTVEDDPLWNDSEREWLTFNWVTYTSSLRQAISWWWRQRRCWWMDCLLTRKDAERLRDKLTEWLERKVEIKEEPEKIC